MTGRVLIAACAVWGSLFSGSGPTVGFAAEAADRQAEAVIELVPVAKAGLQSPLFITHAGDGSGQLFVVEQGGTVRVIDRETLQDRPFLDLRDRLWTKGNEQGLLGLAFHPDHRSNGRLFVNYNRREDGATVVAEYTRHGGGQGGIGRDGACADGCASALSQPQRRNACVWSGRVFVSRAW